MADIHSTRQFHNEVEVVCSAFESMFYWTEEESEKVAKSQLPIIRRLRELLDAADSVVSPDENAHLVKS